MQVALITKSSKLATEDLAWMARACDAQMRDDFATAYGFEAWPVCDYSTMTGVDASLYHPIYMLDDIGVDGALGFHDDVADLIYGRVMVTPGVDTTASHEVLEMRADPECDLWIPIPDAVAHGLGMAGSHWTVAYEACFAAGTEVAMADGSVQTIASLAGKRSLVRSITKGKFVATEATCRKTASQEKVVRVHFKDGSSVVCTPNHRFLTPVGWVEAGKLGRGQRVVSDVLPTQPISDLGNRASSQSILSSHRSISSATGSDIEHGLSGDFAHSVTFPAVVHTTITGHTPFLGSVQHIFSVGPKKQMFRVAARGVVTPVANKLSRWYRAAKHFIGEAVSQMQTSAIPQMAISGGGFGTGPHPAPIWLAQSSRLKYRTDIGFAQIIGGEASSERPVSAHSSPMRGTEAFGSERSLTGWDSAHSHYATVDAVEASGYCDVYDLTVPGFGNFVLGNGAVVHNCDAVEGDQYMKTVTLPVTGETKDIPVSNFVLPSWYDETGRYPFDKMGLLQAPFTMTSGGYLILRNSKTGMSTNVFASTGKMAAVARKLADPDSRTFRRMNPKSPTENP